MRNRQNLKASADFAVTEFQLLRSASKGKARLQSLQRAIQAMAYIVAMSAGGGVQGIRAYDLQRPTESARTQGYRPYRPTRPNSFPNGTPSIKCNVI